MPPELLTIDAGKVRKKRKFTTADFNWIAEYVIETYHSRKTARKPREKHWDEIDRQIAMEPDLAFKILPTGQIDAKMAWMAEMELPLQAQALEVLTSDARRMMFSKSWFRAHAETTDKYLEETDFSSLILGDELDVPSVVNQDNADKLVEGFLIHQFRQYDHVSRWDRINAESFKYGMGVGRARKETKNVYIHEAKGTTRKEKQRIPVVVPVSIRNVYLDDPLPSMHSAQVLGPGHIAVDNIKLENLQLAANRGSTDPDNEDGGWMPTAVKVLDADTKGFVETLEYEGDLVVPRKTVRSIIVPNVIVTVALGAARANGPASRAVVRLRYRKQPYSSYLLAPYHFEGADDHYPVSPLMKGRPVQIAAVSALNRLMDSAALKVGPPTSYDRSDQYFASTGGPEIFPYAQWGSTDEVKAHTDIGGDPATMAGVFANLVSLYAELTGILPARLGAQTVSHTTAFAKDAEIQRGAVRTVDYVNATGDGVLNRWLGMAYDMAREEVNDKMAFFSDAYGGFIEVARKQLPERASFEWFGAGGPAEEAQKMQAKQQSLQLALNLDVLGQQRGDPPTLNLQAAIREILREGTWTDVDAITNPERPANNNAPAPAVDGASEGNPGAQTAALQGINFAG